MAASRARAQTSRSSRPTNSPGSTPTAWPAATTALHWARLCGHSRSAVSRDRLWRSTLRPASRRRSTCPKATFWFSRKATPRRRAVPWPQGSSVWARARASRSCWTGGASARGHSRPGTASSLRWRSSRPSSCSTTRHCGLRSRSAPPPADTRSSSRCRTPSSTLRRSATGHRWTIGCGRCIAKACAPASSSSTCSASTACGPSRAGWVRRTRGRRQVASRGCSSASGRNSRRCSAPTLTSRTPTTARASSAGRPSSARNDSAFLSRPCPDWVSRRSRRRGLRSGSTSLGTSSRSPASARRHGGSSRRSTARGSRCFRCRATSFRPTRRGHDFASTAIDASPFDVNLVCVNADGLPKFAAEAGPRFFDGRYTIGLWWWELPTFPDRYLEAVSHVDEIWVGSRYVQDAIAPAVDVPVIRIPCLSFPRNRSPSPARISACPRGFSCCSSSISTPSWSARTRWV